MRNKPIAPISVALFVAAIVIAATGHWRGGIDLFGATMIASGAARLVLARDQVGALAVRHRLFDVIMLIGAGVGLVLLVAIVPTH
jgi:hypothetical protein